MYPMRKGRIVLLTAVVLLGAFLGAMWLSAPHPLFPPFSSQWDNGGDASKGKRVFTAADCGSCHASPGQHDPLRLGGGLALASPFGTLRVPNISPDPTDGIGRWHTTDLANALLRGVSPQGTHYYPGLPYTSFAHMSLGDIRDLMAYLRTLPKVSGRPPSHEVPFPFNIRRLIGFWKLVFFHPTPLAFDAGHSPAWNRGRYLVEALGHCAECHSSRNALGAIESKTRYTGGPDPEGLGFIPDITPLGTHHWSRAQWTQFLATGATPDLRQVGSSMADVLSNVSQLPPEDRESMAEYMLTLPPKPAAVP
jgi:mono/diheme cytochrome c family protein